MRRTVGFNISDRINIWVDGPETALEILLEHALHIKDETLSEALNFGELPPDIHVENIDIDGFTFTVGVKKTIN